MALTTPQKSLSLFIFENFASPIFLHLYQIECKVSEKLKKNNDCVEESRKAMMCIDELTKHNAKHTLQILSTNHSINDLCSLPKDLIQEILEFAYAIEKDLNLFDYEFKIPFLERIAIIPWLLDYTQYILNMVIIAFYYLEYHYYLNMFASLQYILTLFHLLLSHSSFIVNASMPFNLLTKWNSYYCLYQQKDNRLLINSTKLLLLPYKQWLNIPSLNVPQSASNDYMVFTRCYNHCIYKLMMFHFISLSFTSISHENIVLRQWYGLILYMIPVLYMAFKPFIATFFTSSLSFENKCILASRLFVVILIAAITAAKYNWNDDDIDDPWPVMFMEYIWKIFGNQFYICMFIYFIIEQYRIDSQSLFHTVGDSMFPALLVFCAVTEFVFREAL